MPAVARKSSKPAPRQAQANNRRHRPSAPYTPAKLEAVRGSGIAPMAALTVAGAVVVIGAAAALFSGGRLQAIGEDINDGVNNGLLAGLGLQVAHVHVQGASAASTPAILHAANVQEGDGVLGVDLQAVRRRVERVGWVDDAKVIRLLPDTIVIAVKERRPVAVWQHQGRIGLIDNHGKPIKGADAGAFSALPLVVGAGANTAAPEILPLLHARPTLMYRVEALVRVDGRRWDLRLKDGGLIQLPALDVDTALVQLDGLDRRARVLELGFAKIDLRDPEMIAVRPREDAPNPLYAAAGADAPAVVPAEGAEAPVAAAGAEAPAAVL